MLSVSEPPVNNASSDTLAFSLRLVPSQPAPDAPSTRLGSSAASPSTPPHRLGSLRLLLCTSTVTT